MEKIKILQEHVNKFVATTDDFWKTFHQSLAAPFHPWNEFKNNSLKEWINLCRKSPDIHGYLNLIFEFPVLKGEYFFSYTTGISLTNYRVVINDNSGIVNVSFNLITEHDDSFWLNYEVNGQKLKVFCPFDKNQFNTIRARNEFKNLSNEELQILQSSFFDLKQQNSELEIPKVEIPPQQDTSINLSQKIDNLTQEQIDNYIANTEIFWHEFHKSLSNSFSIWTNHKDVTFENWVRMCWKTPEMITYFKTLFQFPLLKGEFPIAYATGMILTNFRLVINDSANHLPSIPLTRIKKYSLQEGGIIEIENIAEKLKYSEMIKEEIVISAISRCKTIGLDKMQEQIITNSHDIFKKDFPVLSIPKIEMFPLTEEQKIEKIKIENSENKRVIRNKIIAGIVVVAIIIGLVFIFSQSGSSEKSFKCAECGKTFTHQPYQGIMYMCVQAAPGKEAKGLEYFCSCECCTAHRAKEGFKYECK